MVIGEDLEELVSTDSGAAGAVVGISTGGNPTGELESSTGLFNFSSDQYGTFSDRSLEGKLREVL